MYFHVIQLINGGQFLEFVHIIPARVVVFVHHFKAVTKIKIGIKNILLLKGRRNK